MSEMAETTNNPYHLPNKKEKLKVIGNKIKERMSFKIKNMFDKKKGAAAEHAPESATTIETS